MINLLVGVASQLSGAGIAVDSQDRLGRTILHLAAQHGLKQLTQILLKPKSEGGLGADCLKPDLINQRAIHYAIAFKEEAVFEAHLDHLARIENDSQEQCSALTTLNCSALPYTLASFCVIKQSWRCFVKYLERHGLTHLQTTVLSIEGFDQETKSKTARQHAVESDLLKEYEQIVGHFYSQQAGKNQQSSLLTENGPLANSQINSILDEIEARASEHKTLVITDYRCIEHADFPHKRNIKEKVAQRERQPENSDRLALLVDE